METLLFDATTLLLMLWLHTALVLGMVWSLERWGAVRANAAREWLWRSVPLAACASVLLQVGGWIAPLSTPTAVPAPSAEAGSVRSPAHVRAPASAKTVVTTRSASTKPVTTVSAIPQSTPREFKGVNVFAWSGWMSRAVLASWLAGSLLLLWRVAHSAWLLRGMTRRSRRVLHGRVFDELRGLCGVLDVPLPQLGVTDELDSPIALSGQRLLIPAWASTLPAPQLRAVLAHELAHLDRKDPQWRLLSVLCNALLWPVPGIGMVRRRLELLAEFACDARAADLTGDGRHLAECLTAYLERQHGARAPILAVAMAAARSPLLQRAERLLEGSAMTTSRISPFLRLAPLCLAVASALCVPSFVLRAATPATPATPGTPATPATPASPATPGTHVHTTSTSRTESGNCFVIFGSCESTSVSDDGDSVRISTQNGKHRLRATLNGKISFNADENDVVALGDKADADIEERKDGVTRRVEIRNVDGKLQHRYFLEDKEVPVDAAMQTWMASMIPALMRETGIDAPGRVARLMARGGIDAVFDEIAQLHSDNVRSTYLKIAIDGKPLAAKDVDRVLELSGSIGSDFELRQLLLDLFTKQKVEGRELAALLTESQRIGSDFERAELLCATAQNAMQDSAAREVWLESMSGIGSDYEKRRTIGAGTLPGASTETLQNLLTASDTIGSDYEKRVALAHIIEVSADPQSLAREYAEAVKSIGSDFEQREALLALVMKGHLQKDAALAVLDAAEGMGSDFECRQVLVALAQAMPADEVVLGRYHEVAARLSDFEREQAERAVPGVAG